MRKLQWLADLLDEAAKKLGAKTMSSRAKDHDQIVRVIQLYIDGFNDNDVGKFREAFHEDAWIFYVDADGKLTKNLISENFAHWAPPLGRRRRIVSVTQVGDVASVQIVWDRTSGSTSTIL